MLKSNATTCTVNSGIAALNSVYHRCRHLICYLEGIFLQLEVFDKVTADLVKHSYVVKVDLVNGGRGSGSRSDP